jgi:hypothetical protein
MVPRIELAGLDVAGFEPGAKPEQIIGHGRTLSFPVISVGFPEVPRNIRGNQQEKACQVVLDDFDESFRALDESQP